MLHHSKQLSIENTDATRAIRVTLRLYTGRTRAQDDSVDTLQPNTRPAPLGCDAVSGLTRRWAIERAVFVKARPPGSSDDRQNDEKEPPVRNYMPQ